MLFQESLVGGCICNLKDDYELLIDESCTVRSEICTRSVNEFSFVIMYIEFSLFSFLIVIALDYSPQVGQQFSMMLLYSWPQGSMVGQFIGS